MEIIFYVNNLEKKILSYQIENPFIHE